MFSPDEHPYQSFGGLPSPNTSSVKSSTSSSSDKTSSNAAAPNACQTCRSQKRKCDKRTPSCSRCLRMNSKCNYYYELESQQLPLKFASGFFLSMEPTMAGELSIPSSQHPLPIHSVDIDRLIVDWVMTALAEQGQPVDTVLDEYFAYIHAWLAIIHEPRFRSRVRCLEHTPQAEPALILLVMSLIAGKGEDAYGRDYARNPVYALASYLFSLLQFARGSSLELVQAGLLLAVYETGSGRSQTAFITIGTCARLAYVLHLNLDSPDPEIPWTLAEERRRVWLGMYMIDRLIHQVTDITAPHAVEDPAHDFRLPIDEQYWQSHTTSPPGPFQASFSTPAEMPQSYFAREIQACCILSQVQNIKSKQNESVHDSIDTADSLLLYFMQHLLQQTPESWKVMCGANSIAMLTSLTLHRKRLTYNHPAARPNIQEKSIFALTSTINMVRDTCTKFDAREKKDKLRILPLPSIICVHEAARIAIWLNESRTADPPIDIEPLRRILEYSAAEWSLAGDYLQGLPSPGS